MPNKSPRFPLVAVRRLGSSDLSKKAKQEGTKLKALELLGKAAGLFTPTEVQDKAVITAEQLKKELAGHLRLLDQAKSSVIDVDMKSLNTERLNTDPSEL